MLNLTSMTWVFLQLAGGDADKDNKYSVFTVKGFCLLWVLSALRGADTAEFLFSAGQAGWDQAESESLGH